MKRTRTLPLLVASAFLLFAFGCEKHHEGPAEKAGKEFDKGVDKMGQEMEKAGDKLKEHSGG